MIADSFDAQPSRINKESLRTFPSSMIKVLNEARRFKETLSANKRATFFVENILEGEDFRVAISREDFEDKCTPLFAHLTGPIQKVLDLAGLSIRDIDGLEILGGAVRVPKV